MAAQDEVPTLPPDPPPQVPHTLPTMADPEALADPHATQDFPAGARPAPRPLPQIPGYEILGELGRGGMGIVYKARQEKVNRLVALKMVLQGGFASPEARLRFLVEGEVLGRLQHPNIVQIYEVGTFEGQPFFALEYTSGGSLADLLKTKPALTPAAVATLVETLAHAVHYAHANGVIHRDLKPANVLLSLSRAPEARAESAEARASGTRLNDCVPKITDFGLAKQTAVGTGLTATGAVLGTPAYMAPEQADGKGRPLTAATDVYALGAMLYELLAGRPPFVAETPFEVIAKVMTEEPSAIRSLKADLPRDLATICHKCLAKEPGKRYATAEALADDLRRFREDRPIHARPVTAAERAWRWCRRNPVVALLGTAVCAAVLAGTVIAAAFAYDARQEQERANQEASEAKAAHAKADTERNEARRLLGLLATNEGLREAERGDLFRALLWFAEPLVRAGNSDAAIAARLRIAAYRRHSSVPTLVQVLPHQGGVWWAAFSPDNRWVVTASERAAQVWDGATGQPRTPPLTHDASVHHAVFSPDGRWVATASGDRTARVWDAATGQPRTPPLTHQAGVWRVAFSPDSRWVVTASLDETARVWDAATGQPRTPSLPHGGDVRRVAFSPDGRSVAIAGRDNAARVWDAATGQPRTPPLMHQESIWCVAFSPDSRWLVTASMDKTARVWDAATGQPRMPPLTHQQSVGHAAFSPDGRWLVTASSDRTARVWDAATGQPRTPPLTHQQSVSHAAFSPDGRWILTASGDQTARVWDATTGQPRTPPLTHQAWVHHADFSPDGRWVVTASADRTARVWDLALGQPPPLRHQGFVRHAVFSPDGRWVATASEDRTAQIWDAVTGQPRTPPLRHERMVLQVAFSPDSRFVVTVSFDLAVRVWDATTGQLRFPPIMHETDIRHAAFSPDGRWIVTATLRSAYVWDAVTGQPRPPHLAHQGGVHHVAFSPDSRWIITAGNDSAQVWDATTGQPRTPPLPHGGEVRHVAFSPDGRWVVTASHDRTARVWDAATGQPRTPPLLHQGYVGLAAFSPDGRWVVTAAGSLWASIANNDRTARVWDAATGQPRTPPLPHQDWIYHAAFSADGRWVVTASQDGTARVWDAATGQPRTPPLKHATAYVAHAAFSPDGRWIVTASSDKAARLWELPLEDRPPEDFLGLCQLLAGCQIDTSGGLTPLPPERQRTLLIDLRAKYPDDFRVAPAVARQWRQEQIADCLKEGNLPGAFLHQDWMIVEAIREQARK